MSTLESQLARAWAALDTPKAAELAAYPLDLSIAGTPVRVALDGHGHRHLLVPSGRETVAGSARPSVLTLKQAALAFDGAVETYTQVSCHDDGLTKEFDDVVLDVLEAVRETERPAAETARVINRWRRLFSSRLQRGLSRQQILGLVAEMSVLTALKLADPNIPADVWHGPHEAPHDFELAEASLEVKAVGPASKTIRVHGLHQLDQLTEHVPLHLALVVVEEAPDGPTLVELADRLRELFDRAGDIESLLALAGVVPSDPRQSAEGFGVSVATLVPVTPAVPRLVPASLTQGALEDGVSRLQYDVDVDRLTPLGDAMSLEELALRVLDA